MEREGRKSARHMKRKCKEKAAGLGLASLSLNLVHWWFNSGSREGPRFLCTVLLGSPYCKRVAKGFPGGTVVKNPPANAGDTGSSPGLGRSHMPRGN